MHLDNNKQVQPDIGTDISIIIVSWNVVELLCDCLQSIQMDSQSFKVETIVVDNASSDTTAETIREEFPDVRLIANSNNIGFACANNQGFQVAKGRFIFILNPDTRLHKGALGVMMAAMQAHPEIGMVGPRLINGEGNIQKTCARRLPSLRASLICDALHMRSFPIVGQWLLKRLRFSYDYGVNQEVEAISGAAMLVRRDVLMMVNGFDEIYTHCGEDVDLCLRVRQAGRTIYYSRDATITHLGGQSSRHAVVRTTVSSALNNQEYFNRSFGSAYGFFYRVVYQYIRVPFSLVIGFVKLISGRKTFAQFVHRMKTADAIWRWQELQ